MATYITTITIDYVYHHTGETKVNFSEHLSERMNLDYPYLSTLFSSVEDTTEGTSST